MSRPAEGEIHGGRERISSPKLPAVIRRRLFVEEKQQARPKGKRSNVGPDLFSNGLEENRPQRKEKKRGGIC